uniref:Uncharacterized protein n=1 Tax=Termitomyces sp. TaxID=1916073 RepID=A0A386TYF4_9AGAR|nr:hypothetical protein C0995_000119 [Termitomyces sp.]
MNIPLEGINKLAASVSSAAGAGAAIQAMRHMPGSPVTKAIAGGTALVTTQAISYGMSKAFNSSKNNNTDENKYIEDDLSNKLGGKLGSEENNVNNLSEYKGEVRVENLGNSEISPNNLINTNDRFNDFPLNLIPEISQLATAELMFIYLILNVYIVKYLTRIDVNKY